MLDDILIVGRIGPLGMKGISADIGIVQIERSDQNAIDKDRTLDRRSLRITNDSGSGPCPKGLTNGPFRYGGGLSTNGSECAAKRVEENALRRVNHIFRQLAVLDTKCKVGEFLFRAINIAAGRSGLAAPDYA